MLSACACERCATRIPNFPKTAAGIASGALPTAPMADRFLRGCKGDAKKASHVLTDSLCWREEYGADEACIAALGRDFAALAGSTMEDISALHVLAEEALFVGDETGDFRLVGGTSLLAAPHTIDHGS